MCSTDGIERKKERKENGEWRMENGIVSRERKERERLKAMSVE